MHSLFEPFNSFLYLAMRKLDEGARLPELFVKMGSLLIMTPAQMHLKPFGDQLKVMSEIFCENTRVASRISDVRPQRFGYPLKLLPELICENAGVAPCISDVASKRAGDLAKLLSEPIGEIF